MGKIVKFTKVLEDKQTTIYPRTITEAVQDIETGETLAEVLKREQFGVCMSGANVAIKNVEIKGFKFRLGAKVSVLFYSQNVSEECELIINDLDVSSVDSSYTNNIIYNGGVSLANILKENKIYEFIYSKDTLTDTYGWLPIGIKDDIKLTDVIALLPSVNMQVASVHVEDAGAPDSYVHYGNIYSNSLSMESGFIGFYVIYADNAAISTVFAHFGIETYRNMPIKIYYENAWQDATIYITHGQTLAPQISRAVIGSGDSAITLTDDDIEGLHWELRGIRIGKFNYT